MISYTLNNKKHTITEKYLTPEQILIKDNFTPTDSWKLYDVKKEIDYPIQNLNIRVRDGDKFIALHTGKSTSVS